MRTITVNLHSPLKIETDVKTWGELKSLLVNEYDYSADIVGLKEDLTVYAQSDFLPEGDCVVPLTRTKTKLG